VKETMHKHTIISKLFISFVLLANVLSLLGFSPAQVALAQDEPPAGDPAEPAPLATLTVEAPAEALPTETPWVEPLPVDTATSEPTAELLPTETEVVEPTLEPTPTLLPELPADSPMEAQATDCGSVTEIPSTECTALAALYNATGGSSWTNHTGWLGDNTPCDWFGVTCSAGHVQQIELPWNNLTGTLPAAIGNLTNLTGLYLNGNQINGGIPVALANLTSLTGLSLQTNDFTGVIPAEFVNLTNLDTFRFDAINTSATDSTTVCLPDGEEIDAWFNAISVKPGGAVKCSEGFSTCSAVTQIPQSECEALVALYESTDGNNWTRTSNYTLGSKWLGDLTPCDWYGLSCQDGHLKQMWLFSNNLVGTIPEELGNLQYLQELEIQNNQLSSNIPPELGNMTALKTMNLSVNQLTGSIPAELGNLTNLTGLTLSNNQLSGIIPAQLGNLSLVTNLHINNNRLSGSLPPELGNLSSLLVLSINDNLFSGSLPMELTSLNKVRSFSFQNTNVCIPANASFSSWLSDIEGDMGVNSNGQYCYPDSPVLIGPEGNQSSSTITFRWNTAENVSNYNVYIFNNNVATKLNGISNCGDDTCDFSFEYDPYCGDDVCYDIPAGDSTWRVKASNPSHSSWSNALTINIPPAAPALRFPADGDSVSGIPVYQWNASATANLYEFRYGTSDAFDSGGAYSFTTTGLSHQPPVQPLGEYLWRVRARNAQNNWGKWSTFRFVTIQMGVPPAPALSSPADGALFSNGDVNFAWGAATDGNTYQIQIAKSNTFGLPIVDASGAAGVLSYPASDLPDGKYYWRVRAVNTANTNGTWSLVRSFTIDTTPPPAPVLSSPANNAIVRAAPKYIWKAVSGAVRYQLQYDDDEGFTDALYTSGELIPAAGATSISFTPAPAQDLGTYYWRVRALDAAGNWGAWSTGWQVDFRPPIPAAPLLTAPGSALLLNNNTPLMEWTTPANSNGFEILIDTDSGFAAPVVRDEVISESHYTALEDNVLPDGKLYWKVRAKNTQGEWGSWSVARNFTVDTQAPPPPVLSSPENYDSNAGTPAYKWLAALTAKKYRLEIDTVGSFDSENKYVYVGTALTHTPPLQPAVAVYSWRVQACDAANNCSAWSEVREVLINPGVPPAPVLTAPLNNTFTNDPNTAFDWETVVYGAKYELAIDTDAKFAAPVYRTVTDLTETGYIPDTALANNKYYWRVRAQNANDVWGAWSAYRVLTVDTAAPALPLHKTPANNAVVRSAPTFTWAKPAGAVSFLFQYASDVEFTENLYESAELLVTSHKPPAMPLGLFYWRVKAKDAAGNWSDWTGARAVDYRAGLPGVPMVLTPAKGAVLTDNTPQFTWKAAGNAAEYEIAVADDVTFADADVFSASGTDFTVAPEDTLVDGVHYWRMRARNASDEWSAWSAYRNFTVDTTPTESPELAGPEDGSTVTGTPTYTWNTVAGATYYQFRYDDEENFTDVLYTSGELKAVALVPTQSFKPPLQEPGTYYWQVQSRDANGNWSGWGEAFSVIVAAAQPAAPLLGAPAANATLGVMPTFTWNAVAYGSIYQVQIDDSNLFGDPLIDFNGDPDALTYTVQEADSLAQGTYYWRVRAYNVDSQEGLWSAVRAFKVDAAPPLAPILNTPLNDADVFITPTYTWKAAATAVKYEFQYASDAAFTEDRYESGVLNGATALSHKPPVQNEGMYSWRVRACDAYGNWSAWSAVRTVNVLLAAPVLTAPAKGSSTYNAVPTFSWNALANATSYQIQIDNSSTFGSPEFSGGTSNTSISNYGFTATGTYYWRVRGVDADGATGAWSAAWTLVVKSKLPE
jgi:Leucine-rich repeat (LRR) protein